MLNLRSFRDFPEIFTEDLAEAVLCSDEIALYRAINGPLEQRLWLLSWITAKELVQRHCATRWGWTPRSRDVAIVPLEHGQYTARFEKDVKEEIPHPLMISMDQSQRYAAACVRPPEEGISFAVAIESVTRRYPFFDESGFSQRELGVIRACDTVDADQMLTGYTTIKRAANLALQRDDAQIEVTALLMGERVDLTLIEENQAPGQPALRARNWYFDEHSLAYVAAFADADGAPEPDAKIEEDPVLPEARHSEDTI